MYSIYFKTDMQIHARATTDNALYGFPNAQDLTDLGLWNPKMKNKILADKGSVANIPEIPQEIKEIYKTVWELM
jgi:hypothetical protein